MKTILVLGAAGGSGSATVGALLQRGDRVHGTVLNDAELRAAKEQNPELASVSLLDLSRSEDLLAAMPSVLEKTGDLDAVIVCVGLSVAGPLETAPIAQLRLVMEVNCIACLAIYQAVMPMLRRTRGRLILISSIGGRIAMPCLGGYSASKHALEGLADAMRRETADSGVEIILVEPGGVKTSMTFNQLRDIEERIARLSPGEDALYGDLYRQFHSVVSTGYKEAYSPPETIADVILEALDAARPATRYLAGADAQQLMEVAGRMSDRELDAMFVQTFTTPPADGPAIPSPESSG